MDKLERYRGCLLAGALGDQLGCDPEFMSRREMLKIYGPQGVRTLSRHVTDDTQMTLFTAEGMLMGLKHGTPMPECVYESYLDWLHTQNRKYPGGAYREESGLLKEARMYALRAPGNTCLSALESGKMGTFETLLNNSKGCGGVMRTAPCGLLKMAETADPEDAYALQGAMAGAITHSHMMGWVPAAMLADVVHLIALEDGRTLREIVLDSLARMERLFGSSDTMKRFLGLMEYAVELAEGDKAAHEAIRILGKGWVGDEALAIAVYCALKFPEDLAECLSAAVTHDGDSDSTGAIAGNILGAWLGVEGIPEGWLERLEMREVIDGMARRLFEAAEG